jgi:hypothetical protein
MDVARVHCRHHRAVRAHLNVPHSRAVLLVYSASDMCYSLFEQLLIPCVRCECFAALMHSVKNVSVLSSTAT